jgi:hypothetical protein
MADLADIRRAGRNIGEITFEDRLEFLAMATVITVGKAESAAARPLFSYRGVPVSNYKVLTNFERLVAFRIGIIIALSDR